MPDNSDLRFSAKSIKRACYTLAPVLGISAIDGILSDFDNQGLSMYDDKVEYKLSQVEDALADIFGVATPILFKQVEKELLKERA